MPIIKNGEFIPDDWVSIDDDEALPEHAPILVSQVRWQREKDTLRARQSAVGVKVESGELLDDLAADLRDLDLITLAFPAFTDGRSYSAARTLRDRYDFKGEIRAVGNVLRDQLSFMQRCGFDAFDVDETITVAIFNAAVSEIDDQYQPASDDRTPAYRLARG